MSAYSSIRFSGVLLAGFLLVGCQNAQLADSANPNARNATPSDITTASIRPQNADQTGDAADTASSADGDAEFISVDGENLAADGKDAEVAALGSPQSAKTKQADLLERYMPPQTGTRLTFRNNWASLPPVITYRVDGKKSFGGADYLKLTAVKGMGEEIAAYYDMRDFSLKGYRDAKNKPVVTYKPTEQRYKFPMKPGDRWVSNWKSFDHRQEKEFSGGGIVQVIAKETIKLPAGEFETVKVKLPKQRAMPAGMTHYVWFAPKLGLTVKEEIGNGVMNWTQILEKIELPKDAS